MKSQTHINQFITAANYQKGWEKAQAEYERQREKSIKLAKNPVSSTKILTLKMVVLLFCLGCQLQVLGQNLSQTIRGKVIDRESQAPLIGASISITSLTPIKGTTTDADGNFKMVKVPVGRHTLKTNYIGYEEQIIPELLLGSGKELVLTVGLTESIRQMDEVVITAQSEKGKPLNDMATLSARSISVEETKRYAASVNDPARAALSYAGVATTDDGGNEIVVRGNSPKGVLWRLEGIEVPNPNHFGEEGASGGGISILSVNMIDNSDFFTGAFPAEYGNALSGIFDMKFRTGNNEKREHAFQVGVLGVDFATEGPIKKNYKGSYLANYRYSTLAILNKIGVNIGGDAIPAFQDFSFKVRLPSSKAGIFTLWGIGGYSTQAQEAVRDASEWKEKEDHFDEIFKSGMGATGLSHVYFVNPKSYLETVLSFSGNFTRYQYDSIGTDYNANTFYQESFKNYAGRASVLYNHKINNQHTVRVGAIYNNLNFNLFSEGRNEDHNDQIERFIDNKGGTGLWQGYGQWKYRISEKVTLNTGLHYMRLALNGNSSLEPRLGIRWSFSPTQSFSAAFGTHSRNESMAVYFVQQALGDGQYSHSNKNLKLTKARHYVLSYDQLLREDLRFKVETYYQKLYNLAISPDTASTLAALNSRNGLMADSLVSKGTGRNYGVELSLEKFFTNNYYFLITSSLYNSKYTAADGIERNTRFNGQHILNALGGKEFKVGKENSNLIGLNVRLLWAGGNRYTPLNIEQSRLQGKAIYYEKQSYEAQAPDYFRTDIRVSYRKNRLKASYILSLDIQNVTNRLNFYNQYYDEDTQSLKISTQTGLIPVLNYRIEF